MSRKVLMTASSYGHIRSFHLPYLEAFQALGWQITLACGGERIEVPFVDKLLPLPFEKRLFSLKNLKASRILRREIRENCYDLIIMHTSLAAFFTRLAVKGLKCRPKTIDVVHGYLFDDRTSSVKRVVLKLAEYITAKETDRILTMNDYDTVWAKCAFPRIAVQKIPGMGVQDRCREEKYERPDYLPEDAFVLLYPAEFSKRKNQELLIRAMVKLPEQIHLVLPGQGELWEDCHRLSQKLGVAERVHMPGYVTNMGVLLASANAAISTSRSEGLPFHLMEAMLAGLPIVASKVKGNEDLVVHGVNGYVFELADEDSLINEIKILHSSPELCKVMGEAGATKIQAYMLPCVLPQVMACYLEKNELTNTN